jgi:Domain of unknown function (DUF1772)
MFSSTLLLELAAILVGGTMVGNELAVAVFFHPRISALDDATHVRAAQALAAALGRAMPFWYALTLLLSGAVAFIVRPAGTSGHQLALAAAGLFAAMIVYTVLLPVPINNQVARWEPDSLPANWRQLRRRWDVLHAVRLGVLIVALLFLVTSCLLCSAI